MSDEKDTSTIQDGVQTPRIKLGDETTISANEPTLKTKQFLNSVYKHSEDKWLYRGVIFGSLITVLVIVIIMAILAFHDKKIPDGLMVLPTGIIGFISGIFYGRGTTENSD